MANYFQGISSKNVKQVPQRLGTPARGMHPGGVSQLGEAVGNHITGDGRGKTNYRGDPWTDGKIPAGGNQRLGNELTNNVGKGGPGTGRTVMRGGSQGQHGSANPGTPAPGANKPIFPGFK